MVFLEKINSIIDQIWNCCYNEKNHVISGTNFHKNNEGPLKIVKINKYCMVSKIAILEKKTSVVIKINRIQAFDL